MRGKYLKVFRANIRRHGVRWLLRQGVHFLRILLSARAGKALTAPISVTILVTYRCNQRCVMCDFPQRAKSDPPEMTTEELEKLIAEIAELGAGGISFYGGEPLLRKDLASLVAHAHNLGLVTHVATNGLLLNRERAGELIAAGIDLVSISLDSAEETIHDRQRRTPGAFRKALAGIEHLLSERERLSSPCRLAIAATLTPLNINEVEALVKLARELGVDSFSVFEAQELNTIAGLFDRESQARLIEANNILRRMKQLDPGLIDNSNAYLELSRRIFSGENTCLKCFAPYTDLFIDPYGVVFPCNYFLGINQAAGKIQTGGLKEFWYSNGYRETRNRLVNCGRCNYMCHRELSLIFNRFWPFAKARIQPEGKTRNGRIE